MNENEKAEMEERLAQEVSEKKSLEKKEKKISAENRQLKRNAVLIAGANLPKKRQRTLTRSGKDNVIEQKDSEIRKLKK